MDFRTYMKVDKIEKKINEDEKLKRIKECCGKVDNNNQSDFDEDTEILNTVMMFTRTILSSNCILQKTELTLIINQILTNHLYNFMKDNVGYEDKRDVEMVSEKKKST